MNLKFWRRKQTKLPPHPKKHHKPFRLRHISLLLIGITIGFLGSYRGGYIEKPQFDVNSVSPAVVKVYHVVCGQLKYQGKEYGQEFCDGGVGSGFFISKDGYIATSGHVVVTEPADLMAKQLMQNPILLSEFAHKNRSESNSNVLSLAAVLTKLYDLPKDQLSLENKREITFVAIGDRPLIIDEKSPEKVFDQPDTDFIKKADVVATDYCAKDILAIEQKDNDGFSARDVAILKVNTRDAHVIELGDNSDLNQNDPLTLIGFPGDADNQLTSNETIIPSVTNGNVSSIRTTSGVSTRLLQTDADASQGSSGGPALNEDGQAVGIVTYRVKDKSEVASAAKSYVRDIDDLKELIKQKKIKLQTNSISQSHWIRGLELANKEKNSAALEQYKLARSSFPALRLAGSYINQAEAKIAQGKDVKDPPYTVILVVGSIIAGFILIITSAVLITRHRVQHYRYKKSYNKKRSFKKSLKTKQKLS